MNAITKFRLCTLTDEELLDAVDAATDRMYQTGKIPDRQIPARPDADFDLLIGELICRFIEVKNGLLEYRDKWWLEVCPGEKIKLDIPTKPRPVDHRREPIKAEWYEPGMYFRNRYEKLIPSDTVKPGDEIENPEFDENSPYRWRPVTDQHIGIEIRFIENRIRRQYFPKRSVNAVSTQCKTWEFYSSTTCRS